MTFETHIQQYIRRHDLMRHDGFYLLALSGGPDSVALLSVLHALGYRLEAVHCNFLLRGEESHRDEAHCVALCERMAIPLHRIHFDTRTYAETHRVSIEMAARELRYRYFEELRQTLGADGICVAHHRDDQVETVLLHLVRGTGLDGLLGMKPQHGHIIRPMLEVSRQQVVDYLHSQKLEAVTDSTNLEADVQRNKLRLEVIPLLESLNPAFKANVCRMADNLTEVSHVVHSAVSQVIEDARGTDGSYDLPTLTGCVSPMTVLWSLLSPYGFNRAQVIELLQSRRSGSRWDSSTHAAMVDRERLYIVERETWDRQWQALRILEAGTYVCPTTWQETSMSDDRRTAQYFCCEIQTVDEYFEVDKTPTVAQLDAEQVAFPLTVRPVQAGDSFVPFGMRGSKLVSDYLADSKQPLPVRHRQLVVTDASGKVVWLVGQRIDARCAVVRGKSRRVVVVRFRS